jgi:hypothetical protein
VRVLREDRKDSLAEVDKGRQSFVCGGVVVKRDPRLDQPA